MAQWTFPKGVGHELVPSGDPLHGTVLSLQTRNRIVVALIQGSEAWGDVRIEGDVLFPEDAHNHRGFIYRYDESDGRTDFGSLYIKGNSSYIRVNPHHDMNVGRTLYEELRTPLTDAAAIWTKSAKEIIEKIQRGLRTLEAVHQGSSEMSSMPAGPSTAVSPPRRRATATGSSDSRRAARRRGPCARRSLPEPARPRRLACRRRRKAHRVARRLGSSREGPIR